MEIGFTVEEYRLYNKRLTRFMKIYAKFIAQDLYSSIRLKISYNNTEGKFELENGGKKTDVLTYLYDLFIVTMRPETEEEKLEKLFSVFEERIIPIYVNDFQLIHPESEKMYQSMFTEDYRIEYSSIESLLENRYIMEMINIFHQSFNILGKKVLNTPMLNSIMEQFDKVNNYNNKIYYIQSLYEFHNAIAHLFTALKCKKESELNNIKKAATHLHRGILDNYKNYIQFSDLTDNQKDELIEIRIKEFQSIGNSTYTNDKQHVLVDYMALMK